SFVCFVICLLLIVFFLCFFFFFQAEDGIRDRNVTGVQTCALPILLKELAEQVTTNWIASRSVDFPAPFSPDSRVESPKSMIQFSNRCQLISFILVSFFICLLSLSVDFQFFICFPDIVYTHCHQDRVVDQNSRFFISQIPVQRFNNLKSAKHAQSVPHCSFVDHFLPYLQAQIFVLDIAKI